MSPEQCVLPAGTIRFVIMREKLRKRFVSMDELWGVHNGAMSHVIQLFIIEYFICKSSTEYPSCLFNCSNILPPPPPKKPWILPYILCTCFPQRLQQFPSYSFKQFVYFKTINFFLLSLKQLHVISEFISCLGQTLAAEYSSSAA